MTSTDGLCTRVRTTCAEAMAASRLVAIDDARLTALASELRLDRPITSEAIDRRRTLTLDDEADVSLVLALDAINFGSGYHDVIRKRPGLSGARTMAACLRDHARSTGPITAETLRAMTPASCAETFGQTLDGGAQEELMTLFATAMNDLGAFLVDVGGSVRLVTSADRSAERLAERLTEMPYYRDVHELDGHPVAFYKRAQITPADLCRELDLDLFDDLDRLTAFADNLVPHVLRVDGALTYDDALAATIDRGEQLEAGGRAEIEIRAAGVVSVERLAEVTGIPAMTIDLLLWERGGLPRYKAVRRHRARSVFY